MYWYEIGYFALWKELSLWVVKNEMVRRREGLKKKRAKSRAEKIAKWKTSYFMPFVDVVRMTKVMGVKLDGEMRNAFEILIRKAQN
jgi:hypothetical protein